MSPGAAFLRWDSERTVGFVMFCYILRYTIIPCKSGNRLQDIPRLPITEFLGMIVLVVQNACFRFMFARNFDGLCTCIVDSCGRTTVQETSECMAVRSMD